MNGFKKSRKNRIEHIAFSRYDEDAFVTGSFERHVAIWSSVSKSKIGQIDTILDFGGNRLAICPAVRAVVVGSWTKGLAAYDYRGAVLWTSPSLRHVQFVADLSPRDDLLVGVGIDRALFRVLGHNGEERAKIAKIEALYASPYADLYLSTSSKAVYLSKLGGSPIWSRKVKAFAVLHAAFSPSQVAYSEVRGAVYCTDFSGAEIWIYKPEAGWHILDLAWRGASNRWTAISFCTETGALKMLEIDVNGHSRTICHLSEHSQVKISPLGKYAVSSDQKVLSTETGDSLWILEP